MRDGRDRLARVLHADVDQRLDDAVGSIRQVLTARAVRALGLLGVQAEELGIASDALLLRQPLPFAVLHVDQAGMVNHVRGPGASRDRDSNVTGTLERA